MKQAFSKGVAWTAMASWLEQAFSVLTFLLISRLIGTEALGIAAMAFAFLFLGEIMVRETITENIVARQDLEEGRLEATFVVLVVFAAILVIGLIGLAYASAVIYRQPMVTPLLIVASPTVMMIALAGVPAALLRRRMAFRALAIRASLGVIAGGVVGLYMAYQGYGAWSLIGQRLVQVGTNTVFAIVAARWLPTKLPNRAELGLVRGLGPKAVMLRALTLMINQTPTVALGIFAGPTAVGLFAFASRLAEIVLFVMVKPLKIVAQSTIAAMKREKAPTAPFLLGLTEVAALLGFSAFTGLALVADPAIHVLVGENWDISADMLPLLCIGFAVTSVTQMQEAYLMAQDRLEDFLKAAAVETVLGIVLIGFAAQYGPVWATAAFALRALIAFGLRTRATLRPEAIPAGAFLNALQAPLLVSVGMGCAVLTWREFMLGRMPDTLYLLCAVGLGTAIGLLIVVVFMPKLGQRLLTFIR